MARVSLKAVLLGFLVVLVLDVAVGFIQVALHAREIIGKGLSDEQMSAALETIKSSSSFLSSSIFFGTLTTVVGGYVAARIAKRFPYFNGMAVGVVGASLGLLFWSHYPLWFNLVALATVVPAALLGSNLAVRSGVAGA